MSPIFLDPEREGGNTWISYGPYKPWTWHKHEGGDSSNYPAYSGRILDLKDKKPGAIRYFTDMINSGLGEDFAIAVVPSHDPSNTDPGIRLLGRALAAFPNRVDATGCLVRTNKIDKLSRGGNRSIDIHLDSISVTEPDLVRGQQVLLLDDVSRTGNSFFACTKLLMDAGAAIIRCATLGRVQ